MVSQDLLPGNLIFMEVIQPLVPQRLPCYDLAPLAKLRLVLRKAESSSEPNSGDLTGSVYKEQGLIRR